MLKHALVGDP